MSGVIRDGKNGCPGSVPDVHGTGAAAFNLSGDKVVPIMVQAGDVVLASGLFPGDRKVRPAVVISGEDPEVILVCPVSSKQPSGAAWVAVDLHDFAEGGLDFFAESYVNLSHRCRIRPSALVGKRKGRLSAETTLAICRYVEEGE